MRRMEYTGRGDKMPVVKTCRLFCPMKLWTFSVGRDLGSHPVQCSELARSLLRSLSHRSSLLEVLILRSGVRTMGLSL